MCLELPNRTLDYCPVWENLYLISASDSEEAYRKADELGRQAQTASEDGMTYGEEPALWRFAGVRRLAECLESPEDGAEIGYLKYTLPNKEAVASLIARQPTLVVLEPDRDPSDADADWYHPEMLP
jgi:hypothetical protein